MSDLFPITLDEMIREVEREIALRRRVYPNWIASGRLKRDKAERQIKVMEAVTAELNLMRRTRTP